MEPIKPDQLNGIHVLLVDDNDDALYILQTYLGLYGAKVTTASNGRNALAIVRQAPLHVIVSDITMPEMSGLEFIREVRALPGQRERRTPAVAVTAYPFHNQRHEALAAGFNAFLVKPVDPLEVVSYVHALYEQAGPEGRSGSAAH
jgi:CheY-like chemotaxis protein